MEVESRLEFYSSCPMLLNINFIFYMQEGKKVAGLQPDSPIEDIIEAVEKAERRTQEQWKAIGKKPPTSYSQG